MLISKQRLLKGYLKGIVTEECFDLIVQRHPGLFRSDSMGQFDEHFLPPFDPTMMAIITRTKRELAAKAAEKQQTEAEKREVEVQRRVVEALAKEQAKIKRNALKMLADELSSE
jgi:hypothetical protein